MSTWMHCVGVIEFTHYVTDKDKTLGKTFDFKDLMEDDFNIPENSVPYGSEGSLTVFKNTKVLNKDFNETNIFSVTGSLRDVDNISVIKIWLEDIIEKNKDRLVSIIFEVNISAFLSDKEERYIFYYVDEKLKIEKIERLG